VKESLTSRVIAGIGVIAIDQFFVKFWYSLTPSRASAV